MTFFAKQTKSRLFVNLSCFVKIALSPQNYFSISCLPRELHTFTYQLSSNSTSPRFQFNQKQPQSRNVFRFFHTKNASYIFTVHFSDPATFTLHIEMPQ